MEQIGKPMRNDAPFDLLILNKTEVLRDVQVRDNSSCTDHGVITFAISYKKSACCYEL